MSCYRLGDVEEAEDALAEANLYNTNDPLTWGYLTLICVRTRRRPEAEQAYKMAMRLGLGAGACVMDGGSVTDGACVLDEIHMEQEEAGFGNAFVDVL